MDFTEELLKLIAQHGVLGVFSTLLIIAVVYLVRDRQKILLDRVADAKKTVEDRIGESREVARLAERSTVVLDHLADAETTRVTRVKEFFDDMRRKIDETSALADETHNMMRIYIEDQKSFRRDVIDQLQEIKSARGRR